MVAALKIILQRNQLQADGVIQPLLVNHVSQLEVPARFTTVVQCGVVLRHHMDGVPAFGHILLPKSDFLGKLVAVGGQLLEPLSLLVVELFVIVVELTLHRIVGRDGCDGVLHHFNPVLAIALLGAVVIQRNDFVLKQIIDGGGIQLVLIALVVVCALLRQSPAGTFTITFHPPAVEHGEVDHAVHLSLLTRRAAGFERAGRRVHPDVDARNQAACQLHVVVLQEDNLAKELGTLADLEDTLDQSLTCAVGRVGLAREEEEHRVLGVVHNLGQTLQVGEEKVGALVGGEAAAEADHQRVGIDAFEQRYDTGGVALVLQPRLRELLTDILD